MSGKTNVSFPSAKTDGMSANGIRTVQSAAQDQLASTRLSAAMLSATRIAQSRTESSVSCDWRAGRHLDRPALARNEVDLELAEAGVEFAAEMALGQETVIAGRAEVDEAEEPLDPGYDLQLLSTLVLSDHIVQGNLELIAEPSRSRWTSRHAPTELPADAILCLHPPPDWFEMPSAHSPGLPPDQAFCPGHLRFIRDLCEEVWHRSECDLWAFQAQKTSSHFLLLLQGWVHALFRHMHV